MKTSLRPLITACAAISSAALCHAANYTPSIFTDPAIASLASVNSTNGVISGGAGSGQVSLRSAIIAANANAGADTITLPAGTYTLSITGNDADCLIGDLDINGSLTINGAGAATTIIQGATAYNPGTGVYTSSIGDKIMGINQDGTHNSLVVSVNNVTIRWGRNTIPFNDPTFAYTGAGVDVFFTGTGNSATFTNCVFTENTNVNSYGGGVNVDSSASGVAAGTATFTGCVFSNNRTALWGTGLNLFSDRHDVTLTNCNFSGNIALATGGGGAQGAGINIRHTNLSTVTISGCTITGNTSRGSGGGIAANSGGNQTVNISNTAITGNIALNNGVAASRGGGMSVANPATTTLTNVLIANNDVNGGTSGLPQGGGFASEVGPVILRNCTITGNVSAGDGGGFCSLSTANTTMTNVTISSNRADSDGNGTGTGGGIHRSAGTVTMQNTIVGGNFKGGGAVVDEVIGAVNADFSLIGNTTGATITGANNQLNMSARLAALANNGGPTVGPAGFTAVLQTHALLIGSPALDNGSNTLATNAGLTTDQRSTGFGRSLDAADANTTDTVDIGALEQHPSIEDVGNQAINEDGSFGLAFNVGDADLAFDSVTATSSNTTLVPNLGANISVSGSGSTRTVTVNPAANQSGMTTITLTVNDTIAGTAQSISDTFVLTVNAANDKPTFTASNPPTVNEDAGAQTVTSWAAFNPGGGADEASQTVLAYTVSNVSNPSLFSAGPSVATNGALTYTPAANANGASTFQVRVQDSGGVLNGGVDTSDAQTFTITVNAVNDKPSFTASNPSAVNEDAGAQTVSGWVTNFMPGPTNESGQTVLAYTVSNVSNPALFSTGPSVATNGTLTYIPTANASGTSTFQVRVQDNGGTANTGIDTSDPQTFIITVNAVNDAPAITGQNPVSTTEGTPRTIVFGDLLVTDVDNPYPAGFTLAVSSGANYTRFGNTIVPAAGFLGTLTVPVQVTDGALPSNSFNLLVTVDTGTSSIAPEPGGGYRISFVGNPGETYTIQYTSNLVPAPIAWVFLGTATANVSGAYSIVDIPPVGTQKRFYRSVLPYRNNFNTGLGVASLRGTAVLDTNAVRLTDNLGGQVGAVVFEGITASPVLSGFTAKFNLALGPTNTVTPADGASFAVGDLGAVAWGEAGPGTANSLSVCFDTFSNGGANDNIGIHIRVGTTHLATNASNPFTNGLSVPVEISYDVATGLTVRFNNVAIFTNQPVPGFTFPAANGRFGISARTGGFVERAAVDDVEITPR